MKKKLFTILMAFALTIGCVAAVFADTVDATDGDVNQGDAQYERTILLYDCGADLETRGGMATFNLHQILRANFSKDDKVKFIVMTGGSDVWHLESKYMFDPQTGENIDVMPTKYNQIWEAKGADAEENPGQLVLLDGDGILGDGADAKPAEPETVIDETTGLEIIVGTPDDYEWMSDPEVLKAFINYGVTNYPAEKFDLILWDHGGGPTGGFGVDEHTKDSKTMTMPQIINAISDNELIRNGGRFDFVDFDACLMSSVEYIYGLADYMQYYIVSPETEPGYGQDYEGWLNMLGEDPAADTFTLGKKIVDDFLAFYNKDSGEGAGQNGTLGVIDIDKIINNPDNPGDPTLLDDLIRMNDIIQDEIDNGDFYDEARSISSVMHYGGMNFADLGQLASQLGYTFWELDDNNITDEDVDIRNEYTEITDHIQLILGDEEAIYCGGTKNMVTEPGFYRSNGFMYGSQGTSGVYIFIPDFGNATGYADYFEYMDQCIDLFPAGDPRAEFFRDYLFTVSKLSLIGKTESIVSALIRSGVEKADIDYEAVKANAEETLADYQGNFVWGSIFMPLIERLGGEDAARPWLEMLIRKQAGAAVSKSNISAESVQTQNGESYKVTIEDADKQVVKSVRYNLTAELPAVEDYLARPGNEALDVIYHWLPEPFLLGSIDGTIEKDYEDKEFENAMDYFRDTVAWLLDKKSVWNLDAIEKKWYALKDAEGKLHVVAPVSSDEDSMLVPAAYETVSFSWDEEKQTYKTSPKLNLVLLLFTDGCSKLSEIGFVQEEGNLRVIDASQFRGELELTTIMYYYFWDVIRIDLPISMSSFKLNEETISSNSISLEYTDISEIKDIAGLSYSGVVQDIYNGEVDISDIIPQSIKNAEVSGIEDKTYTGKAITQKPIVKLDGATLIEGKDYTVSYKNNTNAGTAELIITGAGKYKDAVTKEFKINKAANKFAIKSAKRKVKAGKTVSGVKVTNKGQGTKTYKIKAVKKKKYAKYFKINSKNGKIKVNKKTPKGKYVVTVKAKAAQTANYKAKDWKTAKVTITVK